MKHPSTLAVIALVLCPMPIAGIDEVTLVAPGGIRAAIERLIPDFERRTGHKVTATFGSGGRTKQQVVRGERFDVPIVQPPYPDVLASGHVIASTETPLATVAVAVAVRKGETRPDISTPDAVRRMLLAARAISYPDAASGAAAGVSFDATLAKLGIAEQVKSKVKRAQGGAGAMALLAKGEVDIGLTFQSEMADPGIDVVGPLPREISTPTALVGFLSAHASAPEAAKALLSYLSSPEAAAVYRANGMQSASAQPAAPSDPLVRENATVKLAPHTYVIPDGNVSLVPNVGIVVGSRATLVIDPGLGRRNGETVLREVAKISRNTEVFVASTHFHAEHTTGYLAFPATAKYVNSTVQEEEFAQGGAQQIKAFSGRSATTAALLENATGRKADVTFDRDYVVDLGGVRVRLLVVGPTHTRGDTVFLVEGDRVLFAGDVVMNNSFLAATQVSSMKAWLTAFDSLDAMRPATVVPSHGAVGDASTIAANRAIMQGIETRVRELKAKGRSADEAAETVQMEFKAQHPDWPRANGLAAAARAAYAEAP